MASRAKKSDIQTVKTELEKWTPREVSRSDLKNAPYNPRVIGDKEKKKLREQLSKNGIVSPITWNVRTGHIVGGHQRIEAMDALMKTKDYRLTVAEIDVDEATEKAINIALNNDTTMGKFDLDGLGKVIQDAALDLSRTGFDTADIYEMFGHGALTVSEERTQDLSELGNKLREIQELYKSTRSQTLADSSTEYYVVLVGKDADTVSELLERLKLNPEHRYHSIDTFVAAVGNETRVALGAPPVDVMQPVLALNAPSKKRAPAEGSVKEADVA